MILKDIKPKITPSVTGSLPRIVAHNQRYFVEFMKVYNHEMGHEKVDLSDEIVVKWHEFFVTINLLGMNATSMVVETGSDWVKFKTEMELGIESMLILRYNARRSSQKRKDIPSSLMPPSRPTNDIWRFSKKGKNYLAKIKKIDIQTV